MYVCVANFLAASISSLIWNWNKAALIFGYEMRHTMTEQTSNILIYQAADGKAMLEVKLDQETVWLTQEQMSLLFGRERSVITKHIGSIFREGELDKESNVQNMHIAHSDKPVAFYNLDIIISVGYRVKSQQGTRFRQWATKTLRDHLVKGYTLNQQRLQEQTEKLNDLRKTVTLLEQTIAQQEIELEEILNIPVPFSSNYLNNTLWPS